MSSFKKNIVLCGFMGSGKSTVGYRLAALFRRRFIDLDAYISNKLNLPVADIFSTKGEQYFRKVERESLTELISSDCPPFVLALGGGSLQTKKMAEFVASKSLLIYLKLSDEALFRRLRSDRSRPKLKNQDGSQKSGETLKNLIKTMLTEREPQYLCAQITFEINFEESVVESAERLRLQILDYESQN